MIALTFSARATTETTLPPALELKLNDYLQLVLDHNDSIYAQMLDAEAARHKARAEVGAFEPNLVGGITRESNKRRNTAQQSASEGGTFFSERNTIVEGGIETLIPTGAKLRLGYTMSDLVNNVNPLGSLGTLFGQTNNPFHQEYQTFIGVTVSQPLLKNGGTGVGLANVRLSALESDIGFQEYRRQLMITISQAEAAYWNLYFAQEQMRSLDQSVSVAETLFKDSQEKFKAGRGSELDALQAQSGLALRKTKQGAAKQQYYEALGRLQVLYGASPSQNGSTIRVTDIPVSSNAPPAYAESFQNAFSLNPDYLIQEKKVDQQRIRLGVSRNQLLPELNFRGAYGYNGLGRTSMNTNIISAPTIGDSWDVAASQNYPSWSVGLELRVPLAGGSKARHEWSAIKLVLQEAVVNLNSVQTQIANAINIALMKARNSRENVDSYQTIVHFNEDLLKNQLASFDAGRIEGRKVLEAEADLFDARQSLADALVQYKRAMLELELANGTILKSRELELTRDELRQQTQAVLRERGPSQNAYKPVFIDGIVPAGH
jgi:outer membrane protein TolC